MNRTLPLANKRILITRSKEQASYFSRQVQELGGTSLEVPLIQFQFPSNQAELKKEITQNISSFEWIVFTSVNGVKFFYELYQGKLPNKTAAVGKKTKEALLLLGNEVDIIPEKYSAEDLVEMFAQWEPSSILLIQGNLARPILRDELAKLGYNVKQIVVYENRLSIPEEKECTIVKEANIDLYTFTSPSTVHNFIKIFGLPEGPVAAIGPITKQALEKAGIQVDICPQEYTVDGLIQNILQFFTRED
ncbi:uroporphyrinogen-III synthase [Sutcliffiella rhizosphaerae]|uniref:Uroporphyrinogen-III synthase n=1 Tax=Sutcliffiella rhizosphaerae TaxID=2880967 RepID=A0ABN8A584_9BACI|nr:uroporphyrinogen-III synthase [Sutcliffiella rhizosphaerae]CAG9619526.1 hypothetical protein BACCIP111883_00293 [Sutcliffiella rhizosphaerae]